MKRRSDQSPLRVRLAEARAVRRNLRGLAFGITNLQIAEALRVHALRDGCFGCAIHGAVHYAMGAAMVPRELLRDADWLHRRIEMPAARHMMRADDELRSGHDGGR